MEADDRFIKDGNGIILGIDIGIIHLAMVKITVQNFEVSEIHHAGLYDLTHPKHNKVPRTECKLGHSKGAFDRVEHLLQEYSELFTDVDVILIERQPITGITSVEQLLFGALRSRAVLVSPNAMHKYFGINCLTYDQRKEKTTEFAKQFLQHTDAWIGNERRHDLADAMCLILFYVNTRRLIFEKLEADKQHQLHGQHYSDFFEQFRFRAK